MLNELSVVIAWSGWLLLGAAAVYAVVAQRSRRAGVRAASEVLIDSLEEAVLVLDVKDQVVLLNPMAARLAGREGGSIGQPLSLIWPQLAGLLAVRPDGSAMDMVIGAGQLQRTFVVRVAALPPRWSRRAARVVVLTDMTARQTVDELRRSRQLIIEVEENTRREIAEVLHGSVQTKLLNVWYQLGVLGQRLDGLPDDARRTLDNIREAVDRIREEDLREISHVLHPAVVRLGLVRAIEELTASFEDAFQVQLMIDPGLQRLEDTNLSPLPESLRLAIYRVLEEALANAAKHSRASRVGIALGLYSGGLRIVISDDGVGFDPARVRSGFGFQSMLGRIQESGGAWDVDTSPGRGTTIYMKVPMPIASDEAATPERAHRPARQRRELRRQPRAASA